MLEELREADAANRLIKFLLQIRRDEKNFALRANTAYAESVVSGINSFLLLAKELQETSERESSRTAAAAAVKEFGDYDQAFRPFYEGRLEQQHLMQQLVETARDLEQEATAAREDQKAELKATSQTTTWMVVGGVFLMLITTSAVTYVVIGTIIKPVKSVVEAMQNLSTGSTDILSCRMPVERNDEIGTLVRAFNAFVEKAAESEMRMRESQRLEAVGQLAGGIAHDFNNILMVIGGYSEMLLMSPPGTLDARSHNALLEIKEAANKAATLTTQLLSFARKQIIMPKPIDLNSEVKKASATLHRLLPEDIKVEWNPGERVWPIKMDTTQLFQILTNLVVNARDAIAGVGTIAIGTENIVADDSYCRQWRELTPSEYVRISVADTGQGMDKETLAKLFQPFFTTKDIGKGTGLGLATVYGAVKQNNGFINVSSEAGKGTVFTLHFPRYYPEKVSLQEVEPGKYTSIGGTETILFVEDREDVLSATTRMLEHLGYVVITALTGKEALSSVENTENDFDLLITDVVMPEMNGKELRDRILELRPNMKSLFVSGYTSDIVAWHGITDGSERILEKPFSVARLAAAVRDAIDN